MTYCRGLLLTTLIMLFVSLASCSTTVEERDAYRETGMILALTAVDVIKDIGLGPDEIDPKVLKIVNGACLLLRAGGPVITLAINTRVAEHNADVEAGEETELVSMEEYLATLDAVCSVIAAILEPSAAPVASPVPTPSPDPVA